MVLYLKGKDINTLITYQISINKSISYKKGYKVLGRLTPLRVRGGEKQIGSTI